MSNNNPLKILAKMSGLTQNDVRSIAKEVHANTTVLLACRRHHFVDQTPDKNLGKTFKCSSCGGTVDAVKKMWYEIGLGHGVELVKDDLR